MSPASTSGTDLVLSDIGKKFGDKTVLDGVSFAVPRGEVLALLGPSGSGKTTLLRIVAGFETADRGTIRVGAQSIERLPPAKRDFGMVFQHYALFPHLTVGENVAFGLEARRLPKAQVAARVAAALASVDLAGFERRRIGEISGGQQQRVALARALAPKPAVLLLDEPLSALDAKVREDLRGEIKALQSRLAITTVMVTHDQHEAMELADRIVVMDHGHIEQIGRPVDLYERPATRFVAGFLGRMNVVRGMHGHEVAGVRPEQVGLADGAPVSAEHRRARVERSVFLGSFTRVAVRIDGEPLTLELSGRRDDLVPGAEVTVRIPASALLKLDRET